MDSQKKILSDDNNVCCNSTITTTESQQQPSSQPLSLEEQIQLKKKMDYEAEYSWIPYLDVDDPLPNQICPYATSSMPSIEKMLSISSINSDDFIMDLGCGDGRIVVYAAKHFGIRGIGVDINPDLLKKANELAIKENVTHLVTFKLMNIADDGFDYKLKTCGIEHETLIYPTIITCYLIPKALGLIETKLKQLVRGEISPIIENHKEIRVITIVFGFERWKEFQKDDRLRINLYTKDSIDLFPKNLNSQNPVFI
eukprot:gene7581-9322_t